MTLCYFTTQVKVAGLKRRRYHSAASCYISSGLSEVVLFGGLDESYHTLADTTVLRFGEYMHAGQ
jgi:hypothetical protein